MTEDALGPEDLRLVARIVAGNEWLQAVLCTLARHGLALRQEDPERAAELLDLLSPWPWFKAGQFVFDLFEWEDFMLDGPPPPPLTTLLQPESWAQIDTLLAKLRALLDAAQAGAASGEGPDATQRRHGESPPVAGLAARLSRPDALPPLEPGLHLYRDVVLGVWVTAAVEAPLSEPGT